MHPAVSTLRQLGCVLTVSTFLLGPVAGILAQDPAETPAPTSETQAADTQPASTQPADTQPAETQPGESESDRYAPNIRSAPTTNEEIERRIVELESWLQENKLPERTDTAPASQPAETPLQTLTREHYELKAKYLEELKAWRRAKQTIEKSQNKEAIDEFMKTIKARQEEAQSYRNRELPEDRDELDKRINEIQEELNKVNAELTKLSSEQTGRENQLNKMPEQKRNIDASVESTLNDLKAYLTNISTNPDEADVPSDPEAISRQKKVHEWRHNLALLRQASLTDRRTQLELDIRTGADWLKATTELRDAIQDYLRRLQDKHSQSVTQMAEEALANEDLPEYLRAYWNIRIEAEKGAASVQELLKDAQSRFPEEEQRRIKGRIEDGKSYWNSFLVALDRRPGENIREGYRDVKQRLDEYQTDLDALQRMLDDTVDEQRQVFKLRDEIRANISIHRDKFQNAIDNLPEDELTEATIKQNELTGFKARALERFDNLTAAQIGLMKRLASTIDQLQEHIDRLIGYRNRMFWSHLVASGRGPLHQPWDEIEKDLHWLKTGEGEEALHYENVKTEVVSSFTKDLTAFNYMATISLMIIAGWPAVRLRHRMLAWTSRRRESCEICSDEEEAQEKTQEKAGNAGTQVEESAPEPGSHKGCVQYQFAHVLVHSAPLTWPMVMLALCLFLFGLSRPALSAALTIIAACFLGVLGLSFVRCLLDVSNPAWRVVPVSSRNARYHARWLYGLIIYSWIAMPMPLILRDLGLVTALRELLWDWGTLIFLVIFLLYVLRHRAFVMREPDASASGFIRSGVWKLFKLLTPATLTLIVLALLGYGALVHFLVRGLFLSGLVIGASILIEILFSEWSETLDDHEIDSQPKSASSEDSAERGARTIASTVLQIGQFVIVLVTVALALSVWGLSPVELHRAFQYPIMTLGDDRALTAYKILIAVIVFAVGVVFSKSLRAFLQVQVYPQMKHLDLGAQAAISTLLHYILVGLSLYVALSIMHFSLGALTVMLGTLGLGIGLGLQPFFVNFISGLMILFERQIKVGDIVDINGSLGEVTSISMRSTKIRSFDNIELVIPNGDFVTGQVTNWTLTDSKVRGRVELGVAYGSDVELVKKLLLSVAHTHENVLVDPPPVVWFLEFADNSLNFALVCWFANSTARWNFLSQIRFDIDKLFRENGVEIPFPQRTISFIHDKPVPVQLVDERKRNDDTAPPAEEDKTGTGSSDQT